MALTNPTNLVDVQGLERFKQKLDPILATLATKAEVQLTALIPVDLGTMTPTTTFVRNNVLAINGVMYRAKKNTTHFPVVLVVQDGQFVVDIVDGAPAYVVSDYTLDEDWEIWGDATVKRTLATMQSSLDDSIDQMEHSQADFITEATAKLALAVKYGDLVYNSSGTKSYTVQQLLRAMADLMDCTVVVNVEE